MQRDWIDIMNVSYIFQRIPSNFINNCYNYNMPFQLDADESISNKYVLKTNICMFILLALVLVINELGLFYIQKSLLRICFGFSIFLFFTPVIFYFMPDKISPAKLKYILMVNVILITLIDASLLSFHITLILLYPIILSTHYHSKKMLVLSIVGSCFCAFTSPFISLKLGTFDYNFLVFLMRIISPENIASTAMIEKYLPPNVHNDIWGLSLFYSIPHFLILFGYGILAHTVNKSKNESKNARVNEVKIIQDSILYSVSDLIESRDSSTGTHVKRTSEVVRILVEELEKNDKSYSSLYWTSIVKAAPMHDLGKISIPDSILQKPGKLTDEEFEIIKSHSQRSADIIDQVLGQIESKEFLTITKNIAKYHHERFDGSGYPAHLKGKEIPYEARIMAIADVFDALVSKRCYKQAISPEEAYTIIEDSMGSHFDPDLFKTFNTCFPKLKEYYQTDID